jgi:hypothetical protein
MPATGDVLAVNLSNTKVSLRANTAAPLYTRLYDEKFNTPRHLA